jgi:ribosomal protein L7/L12
MNIIKFAKLISFMSNRFRFSFEDDTLMSIAGSVQEIVEAEQSDKPKFNLAPMFDYMLAGKKIEAIKEHRALTGMPLKESKDEIERLMYRFKTNEGATLGDILKSAVGRDD